jgi:predicted ATP-grasp superfamily ATP-dependent carboligase
MMDCSDRLVPSSVLIPDGDTWDTVKVLRCLSTEPSITTHILSRSRRPIARFSRHCAGCHYHGREGDDEWVRAVGGLVERHKIDIVLPVTDFGVEFVVRNKQALSEFAALPPLPDLDLLRLTNDKWSLQCYAQENDFPVPVSVLVGQAGNAMLDNPDLGSIKYPALLKPTLLAGGHGIVELKDSSDLARAWADGAVIKGCRYMLQSYVPGADISLYLYSREGEILAYTLQRSLSNKAHSFGPQKIMEFLDDGKTIELARDLIRAIKWNGVACIDFRIDLEDDTRKLIDFNPRFGQAILGCLAAGVNFPLIACLDAVGAEYPEMHQSAVRYAHPVTHAKMLVSGLFGNSAAKIKWREGGLSFTAKDPAPELFGAFLKVISRFHPGN